MPKHSGNEQKVAKITHISKGKRAGCRIRPMTEPPCEVKIIWAMDVLEKNRAIIAEADIRADMSNGDPLLNVLKKVRYVLENAADALKQKSALENAVLSMISIIRDYGEPEGMPLLDLALALYGESNQKIKDSVEQAVFEIK